MNQVYQFHKTAKEALDTARENCVRAVAVKTFRGNELLRTEYFSFESKSDFNDLDLREDFPLSIGNHQLIEELQEPEAPEKPVITYEHIREGADAGKIAVLENGVQVITMPYAEDGITSCWQENTLTKVSIWCNNKFGAGNYVLPYTVDQGSGYVYRSDTPPAAPVSAPAKEIRRLQYHTLNYSDSEYRRAVNFTESLFSLPVTLEYQGTVYILGAGAHDNITLFTDGEYIYVVSTQTIGHAYASLQVFNISAKAEEGPGVFLNEHDLTGEEADGCASYGLLKKTREEQLEILLQYL